MTQFVDHRVTLHDNAESSELGFTSESDLTSLAPVLPVTSDDEEYCDEAQEYLRSVRSEAETISYIGRKRTSSRLGGGPVDEPGAICRQTGSKRRCGYVEYLLQLETRAADKPLPSDTTCHRPDNDSLPETADGSPGLNDDLWRDAALKSFCHFRQIAFVKLLLK